MRRIHIAHSRCKQGFQRGAAPLAHDFGTKSSVLHLSRGVQTSDMQKNHANTLTVQTWDLMLPRSSQVPVTNPDRHLPCHFSKTVLRIPSSWAHPVFFTMLHHFPRAASGIRHQHGSGSDAAHPGIVPVFCAGTPYKHARRQCHFPAYCPILSA